MKRARVGIERKILTSILWVGALPMAVALFIGYFAAYSSQKAAVEQMLAMAASKTADGLERLVRTRLHFASVLAEDPLLVDLLSAFEGDAEFDLEPGLSPKPDPFSTWIYRAIESEGETPLVSLYDTGGNLVISSDVEGAEPSLDPEILRASVASHFSDFGMSPRTGRFVATILSPVVRPAGEVLVGYLTIQIGVDSLIQYALGVSPETGLPGTTANEYAMVLDVPGMGMLVTTAIRQPGSDRLALRPSLSTEPLTSELLKREPIAALRMNGFKIRPEDPGQNVLLAYQRLDGINFSEMTIWFLAYRPTSEVFATINQLALLALGLCVLLIAAVCVKAYRDVHNNIVRPVSLLNEGAQIIRQGDFDLKLKIDTGDEIEELAQSFNKMALELNRNIHQLENSEEKYRTLVTSMRDGIYQTNLQGEFTFLNPAGVSILGFTSYHEALGSSLRAMLLEPFELDPSSDGSFQVEHEERPRVWLRRHDGRTVCVEISRSHMLDDAGRPIGIEGNLRDVTRGVRLEQDARERSERISAINQIANVINSSLEAGRLYESLVIELRKLIPFDYASVALLSEIGVTFEGRQLWPEEPTGPGYTFTLDGTDSYAAWVARERQCLRIEDLQADSTLFRGQFPASVRSCLCVPLYATGRIIGTLNLSSKTPKTYRTDHVDTLEQMAPHLAVAIRNAQLLVNLQLSLEEVSRAREKLSEVNEELKTLDEMKTNLLSNVSHELRTPLVSVMGYTDMILNGKAGPLNKTQQEFLEISLRNVEKLVTLIENLLDFSRLHRGDERLIFDTFDLAECARTSIQVMKPLSDSNGIQVTLETPEDPVMVEGDKGKMGQVFNNLLSNAIKFNQPNGTIHVRLAAGVRDVEVTVTDTGIGIPKEALDKIFTRFYQYDASSTRKYGGTGIGLAIVHDIVRLHGSTITVTSQPGEGSTFRFVLSLARPAADHPPATGKETHILVELVSSDRALSNQVRHFLLSENMDLIHSNSAERAIEVLERHSPDLIMLDLVGDETALTALLDHPVARRVPVLLVTNDDALYQQHQGAVAGRIRSNFRKSTLLSAIHNALNRGLGAFEPIGDKILCVDDDPEILDFIQRCLSAEGFDVEVSLSGRDGVAKAATREFGLVLLDVAMPGMDGWETCRRIKSTAGIEGIKIYMVTAKPIDRDPSLLRDAGADGFLLKPFRPEDLVQLVRGLEMRSAAK